MAIDKNSKAYQALLNSGYTEDQINQMHNQTASGQSASEVVANTPTPNYENQGAGNYVYNETTGYYENTTPSSTPTRTSNTQTNTNQNVNTPTNQGEKAGTTVVENTQSGALKPLSNEYYNQTSDEALTKIKDNLNNYRQTNPEYFSDYESFKKNFSYDSRNDIQKQTLDTRYNGYTKGLELSNVPTTDLYTQYKDGQISQSDLESLRIANPEKYAQLQTQINKGNIISAYDDDTKTETMNFQEIAYQMIASALNKMESGDYGTSQLFDDYENKMNSPEMLEIQDKTTELQEQIENIQDDIASMTRAVEDEYAGKGASRAKINAIIADRTYDLQLQLRTLNSEYNKYATQYNNRATQYQNEFQLQLQEYQLNMQARNQQMNELGFAMDLMNFETNEQKQEREWNYWVKQQEYTNGNINSSDYQTRYKAALKSVENLLSQYQGIPMQRSAEQMAEDILKGMDTNGTTLGDELTKINKQIQGKPEYKYLYNNTFGKAQGVEGTYNIGGTEYVMYNGQLMTSEDFNKKYGGATNAKKYTAITQSQLNSGKKSFFNNFDNKYSSGKGGWCGEFVNDYLQTIGIGRYYDNDLSTKINSVNSQIPTIGSIAVFDYNHITASTGENHGHVAIVTDILPDGRIQVMDSNFDGDYKIKERLIDPNSTSLKGFFDPTIPYGGGASLSGATLTSNNSTYSPVSTSISTNTDGTINLGDTKFTQNQFDDYVKRYLKGDVTYSEVKSLGDDALGKVTLRGIELMDSGYEVPTQITDSEKLASFDKSYESQYNKSVADYNEIIDAVKKMQLEYDTLKGNESTNSQAIVYAFNKILDKGSVVREGEYARTANGQNLLNQVKGWVEKKFSGGQGITKSELGKIINLANGLSDIAKEDRLREAQKYKSVIDKYGLTASFILGNEVADEIYKYPNVEWGTNIPSQGGMNGGTVNIGGTTWNASWGN